MSGIRHLALSSIGLVGLYLFAIKPGKNRIDRMKPYETTYIAHRGLFDNKSNSPENSINAFKLAIEHGYGIELDVQMTTDGQLVVFHDENLLRMCGKDKVVHACSFNELQKYRLGSSKECVPLFSDVLDLIDGKVPLIVEIKPEGDWRTTTKKTAAMLDNYSGLYIIESFHPGVVGWFRKNRPNVIRGQLSMDYFKHDEKVPWIEKFLLTNLLLNFISRPDFIAYDHTQFKQLSYTICRSLFKVEHVAWTIRNENELKRARKHFSCYIFDSFIPN